MKDPVRHVAIMKLVVIFALLIAIVIGVLMLLARLG